MKTWWQKTVNRMLTELSAAETVESTDTGELQMGIPGRKNFLQGTNDAPDSARIVARVKKVRRISLLMVTR